MTSAWILRPTDDLDPEEYGSEVVYAADEAGAVALAPDPDFYTATRAPEFDAYAPGPVPAPALLAAGWWITCVWCQHRVDADGCEDCADEHDLETLVEPVVRATSVFCSQEHAEAWDQRPRTVRR